MSNIIVYGYGNPGRYDDGIGPTIAEEIARWADENKLSNIHTDSNYQLNIEDADTIKDYDIVIFVDASIEPIEDFCLTEVYPSDHVDFTMHAVSPSFVLDLCKKMYPNTPETYLLHVKGYEFELKEGMSPTARQNMKKATDYLKSILINPSDIKNKLIQCSNESK